MPRYYFNLFNDHDTIDEEGTVLADDAAAIRLAREEAVGMAAQSVKDMAHLVLSHHVQVVEEGGREVARVRFGDVVQVKS